MTRHSLQLITRSSIQDSSWCQATLRIRDGGLGLEADLTTSASAFIGSCISTRRLSQTFLHQDHVHYIGPIDAAVEDQEESRFTVSGESEAHDRLYNKLGDCPSTINLATASQRDIENQINSIICSSLKEKVRLRDKARLNTIASVHAGAWLWALPTRHLGRPRHVTT